jgi:hypothetical protein
MGIEKRQARIVPIASPGDLRGYRATTAAPFNYNRRRFG